MSENDGIYVYSPEALRQLRARAEAAEARVRDLELRVEQVESDRNENWHVCLRANMERDMLKVKLTDLQRQLDTCMCESRAATESEVIALRARMAELEAEMDAIRFAAHMPNDYPHGLPSWINQRLYGRLISLLDADGRVIRRSEDIEHMAELEAQAAALRKEL